MLDARLDSLRLAVNENWSELEAMENGGNLVIRVKTPLKFGQSNGTPKIVANFNYRNPSNQRHRL